MPDDSSQQFKDSQRKHADYIKFTRHLGEATGATPGAIRQTFRGFISAQLEAQRRAALPVSVPVFTTFPEAQNRGMELRPFGIAPANEINKPFNSDISGVKKVIIADNGTLGYYSAKMTYIGPV